MYSDDRYVALKILNGYHTDLLAAGRVWEIEALSRISSSPPSPHCIRLLSTFKFRGREEDGEHLCIVTPVLAGNVKFLSEILGAEFGNRRLPLPLAKRIALHMLRGVAHAHGRGVIHTDLKHDNIFFSTRMDEADFKRLLESDPARRHPPELSANGTVRSAVSQPLSPHTTVEEALKLDFTVGDFGNAQHIRDHIQDEITSVQLRPPEIILGGPWSEKVDIWSVGCLLYEFVIGRPLFRYCPWPKYKLDAMSYLLYQIMVYTCEDFWPGQLAVSKLSGDYFDETGNLKAHPPMFNYPFDVAIKRSKVLGDDDADALAAIMGRCLCLNPATRATASELLSDPWFSGVE
ncbi:kinase-like protein [Stereum hirsutum FP-91666 SS1]|uniref:kinase-like protein n=1 Tax=Stereum hirsutum (strain FP-91666) TaxID=721885 RepID=UPI00044495D8|nr:kinase-like protein [Stereum hirsutum FP-91666 SS1]EIM81026.1 kinase-like protein [Stereum hirsutum FP-91666 SS1]